MTGPHLSIIDLFMIGQNAGKACPIRANASTAAATSDQHSIRKTCKTVPTFEAPISSDQVVVLQDR